MDEVSDVHAMCLHCIAETGILHLSSAPDVPAASTASAEELSATMPDLPFPCSSIAGLTWEQYGPINLLLSRTGWFYQMISLLMLPPYYLF